LVRKPVITYITAGKDGEPVPDNTIFADSFVNAISGKADYWKNGFVTGADIGIYVNNEIFKRSGGQNNPVVGTSKVESRREGEFVFALPESSPRGSAYAYLIFFDYNTPTLTPEGAMIAQMAAKAYRTLPEPTKIQVTGFTDSSGLPFERNLEISRVEAEVIRIGLIKLGVEANAVLHDGRGDKYQRVLDNNGFSGVREPRNRRVEIVVPRE
jgi:outer membrane protein OmpA-like peptidoglycan-associated protein